MMPFMPTETQFAMLREIRKESRKPANPDAVELERSPRMRRESPPDPLGMALVRLRPGERLRAGAGWVVRFGRVGTRRTA